MSRRLIIIITLLVTFTIAGFSQQFDGGVLGGLSTNQIDGDTQKGFKKLGFYTGMYVGLDLYKSLGFKIELLYISKGAKKTINKIEEFKTNLNYIEMPLLLTFKPLDNFQLNLGIAGAYLASYKLMEQGYEVSKYSYDMNKFDWVAMITSEYFFTEKLAFNIRLEYSIIPIRTKPLRWFNSSLSFGLTYVIRD